MSDELVNELKLWAASPRVPEKVQLLILEAIGRLSAQPEAGSRDAAIEECAKVCDALAANWRKSYAEGSESQGYEDSALTDAAHAIRALRRPQIQPEGDK